MNFASRAYTVKTKYFELRENCGFRKEGVFIDLSVPLDLFNLKSLWKLNMCYIVQKISVTLNYINCLCFGCNLSTAVKQCSVRL